MTHNEFIARFEQDVVFAEQGSVKMDTVLSELEEWDSMATVAIIALADEYLGMSLTGEQIASCRLVKDIVELVQVKLIEQ